MKVLHSKKFLPSLKCVNMAFCESCVNEKQKRVSFVKSGNEKKNEKLELVHIDVCRPAQVYSLGGSYYYVTFIDDTTRKVWVYFLTYKFDVFQTFKKWKCLVENETGKKLKCLRSIHPALFSLISLFNRKSFTLAWGTNKWILLWDKRCLNFFKALMTARACFSTKLYLSTYSLSPSLKK
ncbi:hypothetical protein, partial [Enterobacter hormaechei]|uniref:hypothetical protein n=1 Tax=Enterobacter hormaechei TaxID=158836 RepID=UPI003CC54179